MCCRWRSGISFFEASAVSDWLAWQVVDSAFPTGAFAHSWGLEAAWQHGEVDDLHALRLFLDASIQQAGYASLPLVNVAYLAPDRLETLDELAEAFLINPVANRTSRVQGRTLVATASRIWPSAALADLKARAEAMRAHVAPLSGAVFREIGLPLSTARKVVLYGAARGVLSAAVRLGIAGSYEAQRMQFECGPGLDLLADRCGGLGARDLVQTAPILDLLQSRHDRLYSRLFQS
jgi:urease accessory protein